MTSYVAKDGKIYVREHKGLREVHGALTANGRDLEKFQAALETASAQRRLMKERER